MRKIAFIALLSLPLFAGFFPQTVHTSIKSVNKQSIVLNSKFPMSGMSGVVIHHYGKDLNAITNYITQTSSDGNGILIDAPVLHHDELPTIKTAVRAGDKVIGGYMYENVLLLAPDADTYAKITSSHTKKWIHPDLFALYLAVQGEGRASKENLFNFSKKFQVGLIYIVRKDSAVLLDPISGKIISQKAMSGLPAQGKFPFYMRFEDIKSGWFGGSDTGNYYQTMDTI